MFRPTAFVPQVGSMQIVEVQPRDVTLITGQPLEIAVLAKGDGTPNATLVFDTGHAAADAAPSRYTDASLPPATTPDGLLRYTYRVEHVEHQMKYRVEVGGTQSPWYSVTIVRQVKLSELTLVITPPPYTRQRQRPLTLKAEDIDKTPVTVPQGSQVELAAVVDVPVKAAMLQVGEAAPAPMTTSLQGRRFSGTVTITDDSPLAVLLTDGSGQIIARLPEQTFLVHCTKDAPPTIEMKWPMQDVSVAPDQEVKIQATLKDDWGLSASRILVSSAGAGGAGAGAGEQPMVPATEKVYAEQPQSTDLAFVLPAHARAAPARPKHLGAARSHRQPQPGQPAQRRRGADPDLAEFEIKFRDPQQIAREEKEKTDQLRAKLLEMLRLQQGLHAQTLTYKSGDKAIMPKVHAGQADLRRLMQQTAQTFPFDENTRVVQKTLEMLALNLAKDAMDLAAAIPLEPAAKQQTKLSADLQGKQRRIISTLKACWRMLNAAPDPTTQPTTRGPAISSPSKPDAFKKLDEQLKQFMKEQQQILDQTAGLAKKPVDNFDDKDKKLLDELQHGAGEAGCVHAGRRSPISPRTPSRTWPTRRCSRSLCEIYSEVTMAKDALKQKAVEIAVPPEENGLEQAKELESNIEKWLSNTPDRQQWTQEDPPDQNRHARCPSFPRNWRTWSGELLEQQEDLFDQMEDMQRQLAPTRPTRASAGMPRTARSPTCRAKGVTGNQLPNNNEMDGRSGEGRSGQSQGEFVGDTAIGKGGRNTPTRLDPTPFAQGPDQGQQQGPRRRRHRRRQIQRPGRRRAWKARCRRRSSRKCSAWPRSRPSFATTPSG